jgi:hypothetical protein
VEVRAMRERALVLQRAGRVPWERQVSVCMSYVDRRGYEPLRTIARSDAEAVHLVQARVADLVVAAHQMPGDPVLAAQLEAAGGRLEYCRGGRAPHRRQGSALTGPGHTTDDIVIAAIQRGSTPEQIHNVLDISLERIRQIVQRLRPPR